MLSPVRELSATIQFRLFGRLQVTGSAGPLTRLFRPRAQRLLSCLLMHRRRLASREKIAFTLWPDSPETEALGNLRRALNELRAALPEDHEWIIASRGELHWNPDAHYWLDVEEFERLIR